MSDNPIYRRDFLEKLGIVAHQSALKDGQQMAVPQFERPKTVLTDRETKYQ